MKWLLRVVWCVWAVGALTACHRRPLLDPNGLTEIRVTLNTEGIANVTEHIYNPLLTPPNISSDMVRLLMYTPSGTELHSQVFLSDKSYDAQGYEVLSRRFILAPGDYRLLGYNFDAVNTLISNEQAYHEIYAYTEEIARSLYQRVGSRAADLDKIYYEPDHLFVARRTDLTVKPHAETQVVEMEARTVVDTYYIQIRIKGSEYLASKAAGIAVLSGLSHGNRIGVNQRDVTEPTAIYFEMERSRDERLEGDNKEVLCAVFNTFGRVPEVESELHVTLSVLGRDGTKHEKVVDMKPIFATEDARERHWLLIDEEWEIPPPITEDDESGGFRPEVDDWDDVEEVIPI
jgi:hypothetical protein